MLSKSEIPSPAFVLSAGCMLLVGCGIEGPVREKGGKQTQGYGRGHPRLCCVPLAHA